MDSKPKVIHFGGHESFPLRHTWLPKAIKMVRENNEHFIDELITMTELGVGKNMAKSVRHWAESSQMVFKKEKGNYQVSECADIIFSELGDQYLEKRDTIWLLHYLICSDSSKNAMWHFLFNYYTDEVVIKEQFIEATKSWCEEHSSKCPSMRTLENDFHCCMNMYSENGLSNNKKDIQNLLASPMKELRLIHRLQHGGYLLRKVNSKEISADLFSYCLIDYLSKKGYPSSITVDEILLGPSSPGRILRLTESVLVEYLMDFERLTKKKYIFDSTAGIKQLFSTLSNGFNKNLWLKKIFKKHSDNGRRNHHVL